MRTFSPRLPVTAREKITAIMQLKKPPAKAVLICVLGNNQLTSFARYRPNDLVIEEPSTLKTELGLTYRPKSERIVVSMSLVSRSSIVRFRALPDLLDIRLHPMKRRVAAALAD
jgi:hypothetical protein